MCELTCSVRQFVTLYILRPMGRKLGIPAGKIMRFTEQGYAVFYFGILGLAGIVRPLPQTARLLTT